MRRTIALVAMAVASILPLKAGASPTVAASTCPTETTFTCINGITELNILGSLYDLEVVFGTFTSLFVDPANQLLSWGNLPFAEAANAAIANAINQSLPATTDQNTKFFDSGAEARDETILHLPTDYVPYGGNPMGAFNSQCPIVVSFGVTTGGCGTWLTDSILAFGVLRPSSAIGVPEPSTALLVALGLLGSILLRVRRDA